MKATTVTIRNMSTQTASVMALITVTMNVVGIHTARAQTSGAIVSSPPASPKPSKTIVLTPTVLQLFNHLKMHAQAMKDGNEFLKANQPQKAAEAFRQALVEIPDSNVAYFGLAQCAEAEGDKAAQLSYYRAGVYAHNPSQYASTPGDGYHTNDTKRLMEFVILLTDNGQSDEALSVYLHAVDKINQTSSGRPRRPVFLPDFKSGRWNYTPERMKAMAYVALGIENGTFGEESGIERLHQALKLWPHSSVAFFYLGDSLDMTRKLGANDAYKQALQYDDGTNAQVIKTRIRPVND